MYFVVMRGFLFFLTLSVLGWGLGVAQTSSAKQEMQQLIDEYWSHSQSSSFRELFQDTQKGRDYWLNFQKRLETLDSSQLSSSALEDWFFLSFGIVPQRLEKYRLSPLWLRELRRILKKREFLDPEKKLDYFTDLTTWNQIKPHPEQVRASDQDTIKILIKEFSTLTALAFKDLEADDEARELLKKITAETSTHLKEYLRFSHKNYQKYYLKLKYDLYLQETPETLLAFGEKMFQETWEEMEAFAQTSDPSRSLVQQILDVQKDYPPREELVETCRRYTQEAFEFMVAKDLVTIPSKALNLAVKEVSPHGNMPYAYYTPFEAFCIPVPSPDLAPSLLEDLMKDFNYSRLKVIAVHEAYPGHHLQYCKALAPTRQLLHSYKSSVYIEGWGLYCEELMYRLGYYGDPRVRLAQLKMKLWRAARVLLDVKLHVYGLSAQEAQDFLQKKNLFKRKWSVSRSQTLS